MYYIISDIHGQYDRYAKLMEQIDLKESDRLFILGDVIDRGPGSIELLEDIMERDNVEMFLGNHEHMMLTYLEGSDTVSWFYGVNGGSETFRRFRELDKPERESILDYLYNRTTLKKDLHLGNKRFILSHTSAVSDGIDSYTREYKDDLMQIQDLVWNMGYENTASIQRLPRQEEETFFISGHIITARLHEKEEIYIEGYDNNCVWVDIDCGCAMGKNYGYLSCLCIDEDGEFKEVLYVR